MTTQKWKLIVKRRVAVLRAFVMAEGSGMEMQKYLGFPSDCLIVTEDELSSYYMKLDDLRDISQALIGRIKKDPFFPKHHIEDGLQKCSDLVNIAKLSGNIEADLGNGRLTTGELSERFERYHKVYVEFVKYVVLPVAIEQAVTKNISDFLLKEVGEEKSKDYLSKLMTAPELPATNQEQIDLAVLAISVLHNKIVNYSLALNKHVGSYQWLSCYNIDEEPFQYCYFEERLKDLLKMGIRALTEQVGEARRQLVQDETLYKKVINELDIQGSLLGQIELLRQYVWFRTYRIEKQSEANHYIQPLFRAIARKCLRTLRDVAALSPQEIRELLSGGSIPDAPLLELRNKSYVLLNEKGVIRFVAAEDGQAIVKSELGDQQDNILDIVKGSPAYQGIVRGVVRILLKKEQVQQFQEGEVLVTIMTSPEFVPAMRKACAIVTDEGGVLCHAAVVAREFKLPCVIGTQKATQVFKDGDRVEVDAVRGIVRRI